MPDNRNGKKWNREETILAFDLYCRIPFGSINQRNPLIIELAKSLGRTPGSVGLKMCNLARFDPHLRARGVIGLANGSKLDEEIFNEFYQDISELSYQASIIKANQKGCSVESLYGEIDIDDIPPGEYRETLVKQRIGQYIFRLAVLNSYNSKCCVTGMNQKDLLIASHIKPWAISDEKTERTNPSNGLCLNALHDKAFDKGLITITTDYKIITSSKINQAEMDIDTRTWFMKYDNQEIILPDRFKPKKEFIEYHNDVIFQG